MYLADGVQRWFQLLNEEQAAAGEREAPPTLQEIREAISARIARLTGPVAVGSAATEISVGATSGTVRCVVHRPVGVEEHLPVVLFLHGGGVVFSCPEDYAAVLSVIAAEGNCVVVAPDYSLAPERPFPVPLQDCHDVLVWLQANADEVGGDPSVVLTMGDSGGGYLVAALAEKIRQSGGKQPLHQILIYPQLDMTSAHAVDESLFAVDPDLLEWIKFNSSQLGVVIDLHVGGADKLDPLLSPVLAEDLVGVPPTTVVAAQYDLLLDEGLRYFEKLRESGVPSSYHLYEGVHHGFLAYGGIIELANEACYHLAALVRYASAAAMRRGQVT